jgi:hypothetical protein
MCLALLCIYSKSNNYSQIHMHCIASKSLCPVSYRGANDRYSQLSPTKDSYYVVVLTLHLVIQTELRSESLCIHWQWH